MAKERDIFSFMVSDEKRNLIKKKKKIINYSARYLSTKYQKVSKERKVDL